MAITQHSIRASFRRFLSFLLILLLYSHDVSSQAPGLVYTESGYDNIDGKDAICWSAAAFHNQALVDQVLSWFNLTYTHDNETFPFDENTQGTNWKSALQPTFYAAETQMLDSCPNGTSIQMQLHQETLHGSDLYRTQHSYTYHVKASVDLNVLRATYNLTDIAFIESADGKHAVAIRIIFCPVNGNFCSPFVVERIKNTLTLDSTIHSDHGRRNLLVGSVAAQTRRMQEQQGSQLKELASNIFIVPVPDLNKTVIDFDVDIQIQVKEAGHYLPLASMQFFLGNDTIHGHEPGIDESVAFKIDMANLLPQRSVHYYDPLYIQSVTTGMEIFTYVIVAIAGVVQLVLLSFTVYYRNEAVMTLSQGGFLIALQVAGLMATICSVLYNPISDITCILQGPMTMIPLQFMFAIVFGRLLRILAIMAPLMDWNSGNSNTEMRRRLRTWKHAFMFSSRSETTTTSSRNSHLSGSSPAVSSNDGSHTPSEDTRNSRIKSFSMKRTPFGRRRTSLRREFSRRRLCIIVLLATLPMVIVEVVGLAVFNPGRTISVNNDESAGRFECGTNDYQIYQMSSIAVIVITVFLDLYQAQKSRKLPALFNEVESVTSALITALFVSLVGFAVIMITEDPETSPDIPYLMQVIIIVNAAINMAVRLVLPKLRLIWKGEKVVISRVLAEHRKQRSSSVTGSSTPEFRSTASNVSYSIPTSTVEASSRHTVFSRLDAFDSTTSAAEEGQGEPSMGGPAPVTFPSEADSETSQEDSPAARKSVTFAGGGDGDDDEGSVDKLKKRISFTLPDVPEDAASPQPQDPKAATPKKTKHTVIVDGQAPPSKLVTEFLSHSNKMSRVGERILSGLQVSREDWEGIRKSLNDLSRLLENVEYKEA